MTVHPFPQKTSPRIGAGLCEHRPYLRRILNEISHRDQVDTVAVGGRNRVLRDQGRTFAGCPHHDRDGGPNIGVEQADSEPAIGATARLTATSLTPPFPRPQSRVTPLDARLLPLRTMSSMPCLAPPCSGGGHENSTRHGATGRGTASCVDLSNAMLKGFSLLTFDLERNKYKED